MPVTRASSKQPNRHDPQRSKRKSPRPVSNNIIVLASSSDDEPSAVKRSPKKNSKPILSNEVIEISDDEDPPPPRPPKRDSQVKELRLQLDTLREANGRLEKDLERTKAQLEETQSSKESLSQEIEELRRPREPPKTKFINPSELEDHVTCEICTTKMWRPYLLPDCGHSFCESCLQDWFSTVLAKHVQTHPGYNVNHPRAQMPAHLYQMMLHAEYHPQLQQMLAMYNQTNPQPEYTCPTCRVKAQSRPIEDYSLKAIVRVIAQAQGEASPQKAPPSTAGLGRRGRNPVPARSAPSPWDAYFPKAT